MLLFVRMGLYYMFAALSGAGFLQWDSLTGTATIYVDDLAPAVIGLLGFVGTFVWSRVAKARGGKT